MDSILSFPLLTRSTRYSKWKLKMISSLKGQDLYEVPIGIGKESYEYHNERLNDDGRDFGRIGMVISPSLRYLIGSAEYPKDLWTKLDRTFGKHNGIIIALWISHPAPQELFTQKSQPLLSLMNLFKMKKKQNLPHSQFELKKVSLE